MWFLLSLPAGGDAQQAEAAFTARSNACVKDGVTARRAGARAQSGARGLLARPRDDRRQGAGARHYAVLQGGYERLFDAPRAYESVTADDIQKLATELLRPAIAPSAC